MRRESLLPFYFGTLHEAERLELERDMLIDPALLLDFLDLKRELEGAPEVPSAPSPQVWHRLSARLPKSRPARLAWAAGLTALAAAAWVFFAQPRPTRAPVAPEHGILFDSGREQFSHSNVL